MALRLLHSADWQIGRIYSQFEPDDASALFEARFQVVERLAALAVRHDVDAVLVAGDVFDAQTVSDKTIRRLFNAMQGYAGAWVLLPGNHDAALAESVWTRAHRLGVVPPHAVTCLEPGVRIVGDRFALLPAPLVQRHTQVDLTDGFAAASTPEGLPRIGLAHGCVQGVLPEDVDSANPIATDRATTAGLDYLALGDWHGRKRIDERTWYAGTPETDRFKANDSGQALLVSLDGPGAIPEVQPLQTGRYRWRQLEARLAVASDVDEAIRALDEAGPDDVLQFRVAGTCDLQGQRRLQNSVDTARARVRALVHESHGLRLEPTQDDIEALHVDGYVGEVLQQLRAEQDGPHAEKARDALVILARLLNEPGARPADKAEAPLMKLRRLRIENFKRFREPLTLEGFADGLNLFAAPNESGKSTVAEAIRAAFFERHRSSSVEHLRPWAEASATPTVEVEFDIGDKRYRLTKAFLGKKRCELAIAGQPTLDGAAAEDHLAGLLGFKFPGKGASAPEHMGIPGLLWIRQGTSHELADAVSYAADHLRQVLGESLGDLTSSSGDALLRAVESSRNELLTPATGSPKGEYAAALQRKAELADELSALDRDITAYQGSVDRLATQRREHKSDEQQRPWAVIREQYRAAQGRLEAAQGLEARQQAEQATLQQWRAQTAALRSELEAFARDDAAVVARQQALAQKAAAETAAQSETESWQRRHGQAQAADVQARQVLERVRAVSSRADLVRAAGELDANLGALTDTLTRARDERVRGTSLQAEAGSLAIATADLKKLKQVSEMLREVGVRLEAAATTLEFDLADAAPVRLGDEELKGRARRTVVSRTEIQIDGVGRIAVQPGGADIPALTTQRDGLSADLSALLQKLLVANLAEAEERGRQAAQRQQDANASQKVLEALAPSGVEALEAELVSRTARGNELRAALAALHQPAEGDDGLPDLATAQAQAGRTAKALEAAAASLNLARVAAGKAQSDHEAARQELAAAQATVDDVQRARRLAAARQALIDAGAQEATAQQRVEATAAELKNVNLALLRQDVDRLARSAQQLEEAHERRRQEITRLEVELETRGAMGLEEQRAERERELEAASRRADELARRAAALDHLLALLREKRSVLARRLRAPLQKHLDHYLGILFPGAHIEVADDLSPGAITRIGPRGLESGDFEELSVGTREQMGIVARLAYADLLQEAGRPTLLILDDALVNTDDDERLGQMKRVLYDAAQRHQVLIFTCHPGAWRDLGVVARSLEG